MTEKIKSGQDGSNISLNTEKKHFLTTGVKANEEDDIIEKGPAKAIQIRKHQDIQELLHR